VTPKHIPVLVGEVVSLLDLKPGCVVVDATFGLGGHSQAMFKKISPKGILIGIERDAQTIKIASQNQDFKKPNGKSFIVHGNYTDIDPIVKSCGHSRVDAVLFDLGLSSLQLDLERGFSFRVDAPLDMRFDTSSGITAREIVNSYPKDDLANLIWEFGQERQSRKIAQAIYDHRRKQPIATTQELADIVAEAKGGRRGKIHPATLTFQALRIAVNQELANIKEGLPEAFELLNVGGRLAVISYHSLEDKIVKNYFRDLAKSKQANLITKKPVIPSRVEINSNPRARSAKLRVLEKI